MSFEELKDMLVKLVSGLPVNAAPQAVEPVYFDRSEATDGKWKSLVTMCLKTAKTFEIHCWNEEGEWIKLALQYGQEQKTDRYYGTEVYLKGGSL